MSRINDLIQELCPDGVIFEPLSKLFNIRNGYTPAKSNATFWDGTGTIPWFRMEDIRANGRILDRAIQTVPVSAVKNGVLFPANSLLIATSATIGEHALITVPHLSNQRFTSLSLKTAYKESLSIRYLYYYCFLLDEWCRKNTSFSSFASVNMNKFKQFRIPIPPMEVQEEIVRILDSFTSLEAELDGRILQYQHYRDSMFEAVERRYGSTTLGKVGIFIRGQGLKKSDFSSNGVNCIHYGQVYTQYDIATVECVAKVPEQVSAKLRHALTGDLVIATTSENDQDVCKAIAWLGK